MPLKCPFYSFYALFKDLFSKKNDDTPRLLLPFRFIRQASQDLSALLQIICPQASNLFMRMPQTRFQERHQVQVCVN